MRKMKTTLIKTMGESLLSGTECLVPIKRKKIDETPIYGIRSKINTFNPIWANLHIYVKMAKDIWHAQSWKEKFFVPFARTGWQPASLSIPADKDDFDPMNI